MPRCHKTAVYSALLALFIPLVASGIAWSVIDKAAIYEDARFIGTAVILSGDSLASDDDPNRVCAVTYTARVTDSVLGPSQDSMITLHVLQDHREDMQLGFLEVGSEYFVFAGDRESHDFVQITDVWYRRDETTAEDCHATTEGFYVFQEFSGRVNEHDDDKVLQNLYIRQIEGALELKSYYYSDDTFDYYMEPVVKTKYEQTVEGLSFIAVPVSSLFEFFAESDDSTE